MTRKRVAVAMSGGVDSSVAAALLVEQGHEVIGLTMQIWPREPSDEIPPGLRGCCGLDALDSARRVARTLGIKHYVLDLRAAFEQQVIAPFCDEYANGRTPNPCLRCNTYLKFGALLRRAEEIGAAHLATGHYARLRFDEHQQRWLLLRGADRKKDQSYSLYGLDQKQLARAFFPLGEMTKAQTRAEAARLGLPIAAELESQEICFASGRHYAACLLLRRPELARPGPIIDRRGRQLGRHRGIACYTIGQRHRLGVAAGKPLYVIAIDAEGNRLIVGEQEELVSREVLMGEVNYVSLASLPPAGLRLRARIRSTAPLAPCTACADQAGVRLSFPRPPGPAAPGQAAVCYQGEAVALGGIIQSAW